MKSAIEDIPGVIEKGIIIIPPGQVAKLPLSIISRNENQPRKYFNPNSIKRMAGTFREEGDIDHPIKVALEKGGRIAKIVAGERRYRAAQEASLNYISCYISPPKSDLQLFKSSLRENVCREDMSPVEEALAYKRIREEEGSTVEEIAEEYGRDKHTVYAILRYLELHKEIQDLVVNRKIEKGIAKLLTSYKKPHQLEIITCLKNEIKKRGKPMHPNEALIVIRKYTEENRMNPKGGRKGRKQRTYADLVCSSLLKNIKNCIISLEKVNSLSRENLVSVGGAVTMDIESGLKKLGKDSEKIIEKFDSLD